MLGISRLPYWLNTGQAEGVGNRLPLRGVEHLGGRIDAAQAGGHGQPPVADVTRQRREDRGIALEQDGPVTLDEGNPGLQPLLRDAVRGKRFLGGDEVADGIAAEYAAGHGVLARPPEIEDFLSRLPAGEHVAAHHPGAHQLVLGFVVIERQRLAGRAAGVADLRAPRIGAARQHFGQVRDDIRLVQDRQAGDVARETGGQRAMALAIETGVFGGEADDGVQITALLVQQLLTGQRLGGEQGGEPGVALRALAAMQPVLQCAQSCASQAARSDG